jgi:hypothetical protein
MTRRPLPPNPLRRAALRAVLALATAAAPALAQGPMPEGAALQRALEGLWCNSHDGGATCWAWDEFGPDGRLRLCGRAEGDPRPFHGTGIVAVEGRRLCYRVESASDNFWLPAGQTYCTAIVAIDTHTHRYRDLDSGAEFTLHRRPAAARDCPR